MSAGALVISMVSIAVSIITIVIAIDIKKAPCANDPNLVKAHKVATITAVTTSILAGLIITLFIIKILL